MGVLSLAFILIPFIPGVRDLPRTNPDLQADLARSLPNPGRRTAPSMTETTHPQPKRHRHRCGGI